MDCRHPKATVRSRPCRESSNRRRRRHHHHQTLPPSTSSCRYTVLRPNHPGLAWPGLAIASPPPCPGQARPIPSHTPGPWATCKNPQGPTPSIDMSLMYLLYLLYYAADHCTVHITCTYITYHALSSAPKNQSSVWVACTSRHVRHNIASSTLTAVLNTRGHCQRNFKQYIGRGYKGSLHQNESTTSSAFRKNKPVITISPQPVSPSPCSTSVTK
ncbi:hypothetical protein F5883DRAFT_166310 [Diaporthe sp. PMI_573]|nr:hypothetical protein F5883DRAFT_166310 [Diaporthaceae sp. PMI_573]